MLAKLSSKNQLTLPQAALDALGEATHFRVEVEGDRLVLIPARPQEVEALDADAAEVADCKAWAGKFR